MGRAFGPSRDPAEDEEYDQEGGKETRRVDQVEDLEGPQAMHVDDKATHHATDADAEVEQREVDAVVPLTLFAGHDVGHERIRRRPGEALADTGERHRQGGETEVVCEGQGEIGADISHKGAGENRLGAEAVDQHAAGREHDEGHEGR